MFYQLNLDQWEEYRRGWPITKIFRKEGYSVGIMTGQDKLTITNTPTEIQKVIIDILTLREKDLMKKYNLKPGKRQWTQEKAIKDLKEFGITRTMTKAEIRRKTQKNIVPILYRPYDKRYTFFTGNCSGFHERPRAKIMKHMINGKNIAIIVSRNTRPAPWRDIQVTEDIIELGVMATRPGNNAPIFPLFLYEETESGCIRKENLSLNFKEFIEKKYYSKKGLTAEDILYYIYAILHSKVYRTRYEDFLKINFPRIPFPKEIKLFFDLKNIGKELINVQLMKSKKLEKHDVKLMGKGINVVSKIEKIIYMPNKGIRINDKQYFDGIHEEVYNFFIGGYRVVRKWLQNHRGKVLTEEDVLILGKIVKAIQETIRLMDVIDRTIQEYQGWPEAFQSDKIYFC